MRVVSDGFIVNLVCLPPLPSRSRDVISSNMWKWWNRRVAALPHFQYDGMHWTFCIWKTVCLWFDFRFFSSREITLQMSKSTGKTRCQWPGLKCPNLDCPTDPCWSLPEPFQNHFLKISFFFFHKITCEKSTDVFVHSIVSLWRCHITEHDDDDDHRCVQLQQ